MQEHDAVETVETPQAMPTTGERLKEAREAKGLSLQDVATATRLRKDMLESLETMQVDGMSPTILRMQAATYANFLGLPGDEIANGFAEKRSQTSVDSLPEQKLQASQPRSASRLVWPLSIAAAASVVGAIGLVAISATPTVEAELPVYQTIAVKTTTADSNARQSAWAAEAREEVSIRATADAWIEVRGSDGTIFRNRMMRAGEAYYPRMDAGWTITVRDASAFEWWLGDQMIKTIGEAGQSLYSISIDAAVSEGREALKTSLASNGAEGRPAR